jgi:hypothetical protein
MLLPPSDGILCHSEAGLSFYDLLCALIISRFAFEIYILNQ